MPRCIVASCKSYTHNFSLPADRARRTVWLQRSGHAGSVDLFNRNQNICELHFHEKCFLKPNRLTAWALPSLFLPNYYPTGGHEDICFQKPTETKPPSTPEIVIKGPCHKVEYSPVRNVRTPVKTYERRTSVDATVIKREAILARSSLDIEDEDIAEGHKKRRVKDENKELRDRMICATFDEDPYLSSTAAGKRFKVDPATVRKVLKDSGYEYVSDKWELKRKKPESIKQETQEQQAETVFLKSEFVIEDIKQEPVEDDNSPYNCHEELVLDLKEEKL